MSLADYPNQLAVFCHNSCTKLMVDKRVWPIKRWRINENSLYNEFSLIRHNLFYEIGWINEFSRLY